VEIETAARSRENQEESSGIAGIKEAHGYESKITNMIGALRSLWTVERSQGGVKALRRGGGSEGGRRESSQG